MANSADDLQQLLQELSAQFSERLRKELPELAQQAAQLASADSADTTRDLLHETLRIDGVEPYGFSLLPSGVMTAVDNERIQIDLAALQWQSDFRGQATGQGRCEKSPA